MPAMFASVHFYTPLFELVDDGKLIPESLSSLRRENAALVEVAWRG